MNYAIFKASAAILEARLAEASVRRAQSEADIAAELGVASRGSMNLIAEAIRIHPDYRAAMLAEAGAFQALRRFNGMHAKHFSKEIRGDIEAKRRAKLQAYV